MCVYACNLEPPHTVSRQSSRPPSPWGGTAAPPRSHRVHGSFIPRSQPGHGQACGAPGTPQPAEASPSPRRPRTLTGGLCGRISVGQETGNCPRDGLRSPLRRQRPLPETAGLPGGEGAPSYPRHATGQQPWEAAAPARHLREDTPRARWSLRLLGRRWGRPTLGPESLPGSWWVCGFLRVQGRPAHHPLPSRVLTRRAHPGTGAEDAPNAHTRQVCATPQLGTLGLPGPFPQGQARPVHRGRRPRTTQRFGGRTRRAGDSWRSREAGLPRPGPWHGSAGQSGAAGSQEGTRAPAPSLKGQVPGGVLASKGQRTCVAPHFIVNFGKCCTLYV